VRPISQPSKANLLYSNCFLSKIPHADSLRTSTVKPSKARASKTHFAEMIQAIDIGASQFGMKF
jgi:hypothetical protein